MPLRFKRGAEGATGCKAGKLSGKRILSLRALWRSHRKVRTEGITFSGNKTEGHAGKTPCMSLFLWMGLDYG